MNTKTAKKDKAIIKANCRTINPQAIINAYAKQYGIPAKDIFLEIFYTGNDLYAPECENMDWLINESILTGAKNEIEIVPQYWERGDNTKRVEAIRDAK